MKLLRSSIAVTGVLAAALTGPAAAGARPVDAPLLPKGSAARVAKTGCDGKLDRIHHSTHVPGTINVVARTICPGFAVGVNVALYKKRWWGNELVGTGTDGGFGRTKASASAICGHRKHTFLAIGFHTAVKHASRTTHRHARLRC